MNLPTRKGTRPLHLAILNDQSPAVQCLLDRGASVAATNNACDSALHMACVKHNPQILQLLLQSCTRTREECYLQNSQGFTPIAIATLNNQPEIVRTLVSSLGEEASGAGFVDDKGGNTLLHLAAEKGFSDVMRVLVEDCKQTVKIEAKNRAGKSAYDLAHEHFFAACCSIIEHERTRLGLDEEGEESEDKDYNKEGADKAARPFKELWVHVDLKGAPPKPEFFSKLFDLLRNYEVTGILLEVEDMLDFTGSLACIRRPNYYTDEQIQWIIKEADAHHMQTVPLVQCFGHLEFMLKRKEFSKLRELADSYLDICPSHPETMKVITSYIGQVLQKFPAAKSLHIGADEVCFIGSCAECKLNLIESSRDDLYFRYLEQLIKEVKKTREVEIMIWDDMIR